MLKHTRRLILSLALVVCLLVDLSSWSIAFAQQIKPTTKAEFLSTFLSIDLHEQNFGITNISESLPQDPINHCSVFTQNGMGFQLSETDQSSGNLFADPNDVTVMNTNSIMTIAISGTTSVYSAFLALITTDIAGNYIPGSTISVSVNGEALEDYVTTPSFADNGYLVLSEVPISTIEIDCEGISAWQGISYLVLASKKLTPLAPCAPTVSGEPTDTAITLSTIDGAQYSIDSGATWQDSPVFEGLTPGTDYSFIARIKETDSNYVSESSAPTIIKTDKPTPTAPAAPTVSGEPTDTAITLSAIEGAQYSIDSGATWQDSPVFEGLTPSTDYSFIARIKENEINNASMSSTPTIIKTDKLTPTAPPAPTVSGEPTDTAITLSAIDGAQYSIDSGATWQDSLMFEGLTPSTGYLFIARVKETETNYASSISEVSATITTAIEIIQDTDVPSTGDATTAACWILFISSFLCFIVVIIRKQQKPINT